MKRNIKTPQKIAIVTGCGQGLGREVCSQLAGKGFQVIATYKNLVDTRNKISLSKSPLINHVQMDVTNHDQVIAIITETLSKHGDKIDILVNNAGVYLDPEVSPTPKMLPLKLLTETLDVNLLGAARTMEAILPSMLYNKQGTIVNVSSGMGRLVELDGNAVYYRTSKAALTTLTRCVAMRVKDFGINVVAVCPGWVRTAMGGSNAVRSVKRGAAGIVSAAISPPKNGVLLRDLEDFGW